MTTTTLRCACGRRMSKNSRECTKCWKASMEKHHEAIRAIVRTGKCPDCGAGLRRNSSMAGWYQCEQYGAEGWRKDSSKPSCGWQGFTE